MVLMMMTTTGGSDIIIFKWIKFWCNFYTRTRSDPDTGYQRVPTVPRRALFSSEATGNEQHRPLQASNSMFNSGLEVENKITYMILMTICPLRAFLHFSNIK